MADGTSSGTAAYHHALKLNDRYYTWKLGFRIILVATDIALLGMIAWFLATAINLDGYYFDDVWVAFDLIPVGISLIYCGVVLAYQLLRRKPVHPGWDVGVDLIAWLAFAILASFTVVFSIGYSDGSYDSGYYNNSGSDSGYYITAANGTEVYIPPNSDEQCPAFQSCAAQDAFNASLRHRGIVEIVIYALMFFAMVIHFALFVWGCIDTAARNSNTVQRDAKELAQAMIAEMVASGQIPAPQQPLLFPGASQRVSQVGSHTSQEHGQPLTSPSAQPVYQQTGHGYYAPVPQQAPHTSPQEGSWPLQSPAAPQMSEKQALAANMPPPPRQTAVTPQGQGYPHQQLQPPPQVSSMTAAGRAESPTIPPLATAGEIRRQSSNSPGPSMLNGNGWHTPPTQQTPGSERNEVFASGAPAIPTRAPGHTSRRQSNASAGQRQSFAQ